MLTKKQRRIKKIRAAEKLSLLLHDLKVIDIAGVAMMQQLFEYKIYG